MRRYLQDWLSLLIAVAVGLALSATIMLAVWMSRVKPLRGLRTALAWWSAV